MSVLVLGVMSYPSTLPNLDQDITAFDFQIQLGNIAFADEDEEDDEEENDEDEHPDDPMEDAADAISDANEEIEKADEKIAEASDKGEETSSAEQQLEEAIAKRDMAQENFDLKNFEEAEELAEEAEDLAEEARDKLGKTQEDLEENDEEHDEEEEFEGVIVSVNEDGSITIETKDGNFTIFTNNNTEFDGFNSLDDLIPGFGVEVEVVLSNSSLVATEIEVEEEEHEEEVEEEEHEEEIEIEVEVEHGMAKVKVEFYGNKTKFVEDFVDEESIAEAILIKVPDLPLSIPEIMGIWDLDIEDEDYEDMSAETIHEHEEESIQTALDLIHELQQKIEQLEDRIQTLLEKYESGEYFGTVPEVDSEIKSYAISFVGSATSMDDENIVDAKGQIFIENLVTVDDSISKFRVTGGEISIDDTFYDIAFGKARVSSTGPSGEKDTIVLLGQIIDFVKIDDDSTTLKLVIDSETSLEGDFGIDPISIEILPQSKIAGQWHLSGSGELSLLES